MNKPIRIFLVIFAIIGILHIFFPEYAWLFDHGMPKDVEPSDLGVLITRIEGYALSFSAFFYFCNVLNLLKGAILMITAIAAVSENWGIGKDNDLLFNIPEDKKFFRRLTLGHTVVMGRKTLESLPNGKPFKDRNNIILSRDTSFTCEGAEVCGNVEEVLELVKDRGKVFVAGGGEIYREMLPYCSNAVITKVDAAPEADVFFPNLDEDPDWIITNTLEDCNFEGLTFRYCFYEKK